MSVDELIEGLSAEAREAMRPLLRQAYDRGFREGLAGAGVGGVPAVAAQPAPDRAAHASAAVPAPVEWAGRTDEDTDESLGDEGDDGEDDDNDEEAPAPRPIRANAKVGTLHRRIIRTFDLERFDIDVVICRARDPLRRQLKSNVQLATYRRLEE